MRRKILWMHISVFCVALYFATENWSQAQAPDKGLQESVFGGLVKPDEPGFAVLLRYGGRDVFTRTEGVRDLRSKARIDPHTNFRLASFTKQFTAMSIMLLVRDAKLRYDQPVTEIFPDFPAYGRAITIRHLLTHTSGLPDYEDLMDHVKDAPWSATHQIQDQEVLQLLEHETTPKFAPGTKWAYSNSGYVLLGLIVAKTSGQPFENFVHDRIFAPLHMNATLMYVKGANTVPNRAFGHTKRDAGFEETDQSSTSATLGDGGIYSNLEDLAKWDAALDGHTLLAEEGMHPALLPVKLKDGSMPNWPAEQNDDNLNPGKPVSYGFGWFLDPYQGRARMWHSGSSMGFRTIIDRFTTEKLTVVILSNRSDLDPKALAVKTADLYLNLKPKE